MNEVLAKYVEVIPVIKDALGLDMVSVTDGYNFVGYWKGDKISADIHVGDELSHKDPMWEVFQSGRKIEAVMPADVYGFEFKAIMLPIRDGARVVGTLGIAISLENQAFTLDTSDKLIDNINLVKEDMDVIGKSGTAVKEKTDVLKNTTEQLVDSLSAIHKFVNEINAISSKTNMLALNASIEAARSGPAGAGFAVVATSMRNLAVDTKDSSTEILELLDNLSEAIDNMEKAISEVNDVQEAQNEKTTELSNVINSIEALTKDLAVRIKK